MIFFLVLLFFLVLFGVVEILQKKFGIRSEYTRKIAHIGSGVFVFFFPYLLSVKQIFAVAIIFTVFLTLTRIGGFLGSIHKVSRKTLGELYFPLGVGLSAFFFLPRDPIAFQFGILVLGFSDAMAGLIGEKFGKHKIKLLSLDKSWEGSVAFFLSTFAIFCLMIFFGDKGTISAGLLISAILTVIELFLWSGLDNLLLPVFAAFLIRLLVGI